MASFRKRNDKWQVQVRRLGAVPVSRTFQALRDAKAWARATEGKIDQGGIVSPSKKGPPLDTLLERYLREVTPTKRSASVERYRIRLIQRHSIAKTPANLLTSVTVAAFRDERLKRVSGETVRQDLVLLQQVFETARLEWRLVLVPNPVKDVRKPKAGRARTRRLLEGEREILERALLCLRSQVVADVVRFALASGFRRSEILRLAWRDIDWKLGVVFIAYPKNGYSRFSPLPPSAERILLDRRVAAEGNCDRVFPTSANAVRLAWQRLKRKTGLKDLRLHDLRHEAISHFFEIGLSVPEVAIISGHRDPRQLMRYTHLKASRVSEKLRGEASSRLVAIAGTK